MKSFQCRFLTLVNNRVNVVLFILLAIILGACNDKDDDEESPTIDFQFPQEFQTFSSIDTIPFLAYVSDNKQVKTISIDLQTLDFKTVMSRQRFNVSGSVVTFSTDLFLNEPFLESGSYYFVLTANDGNNESSAFVQVHITAIEKEIEQFIVVTKAFNSAKVFSSTDLSNWVQRLDLFMDITGAALNYRQNLLALCGGEIGDAVFYETEEFDVQSSIPGFGTPSQPYFSGIDFDPEIEQFFLLQTEPRVKVLDKHGSGLYSFELQQGHRPDRSFRAREMNWISQNAISTPNTILSTYSQAGLLFSVYTVNGATKLVTQKNATEFFLWTNGINGTQLSIVYSDQELIAPVYDRIGESLLAVMEIETGVFLLSTDQGMYRYSYSNGGTTVLNATPNPTAFYYEAIDGLVYATEGNTLYVLSLNGDIANSVQFSAPIAHFAFDYNR